MKGRKCTVTGRVVYNRTPRLMKWRDAWRIVRGLELRPYDTSVSDYLAWRSLFSRFLDQAVELEKNRRDLSDDELDCVSGVRMLGARMGDFFTEFGGGEFGGAGASRTVEGESGDDRSFLEKLFKPFDV